MLRALARTYRESFSGLPREVWLLSAALLVNRAGTMVLPFLALYLTQRLGFTAGQAGQVLGLYGLGAIGGAWLGGWLSDRVDPNRVQQASLVGAGIGFVVLSRLETFAGLAIAVVAVGIVADAARPAVMSATARYSAPHLRPRAFALVRLAINLGMSVGPAIGGFLATRRYGWLFVANAAACWAAAAVLVATLGRVPAAGPGRAGSAAGTSGALAVGPGTAPAAPRSPWTDPPYVAFLVLVAVQAMMFFQLFSTYPLHLRDHYAMPESVIGLLLAGNAITIVFVEMVLVRAVEHRHPLRVAAWGALLIGLGLGLLPLGPPAWVAVASVAVWTAGEMLALPMTNVAAANRAPEGASGRYMGAYTVAFSSAFVIGPLAGTALYEGAGPGALWGAVAATGALLWAGFMALAPVFRHDRHAGGLAPAAPAPAPPGGSDDA